MTTQHGTVHERSTDSYRFVTKVATVGEEIRLPDGANHVRVKPLSQRGLVQVTYLKPVRELEFESADDPENRPVYLG